MNAVGRPNDVQKLKDVVHSMLANTNACGIPQGRLQVAHVTQAVVQYFMEILNMSSVCVLYPQKMYLNCPFPGLIINNPNRVVWLFALPLFMFAAPIRFQDLLPKILLPV